MMTNLFEKPVEHRPLSALAVAPENMRYGQDADDDIPALAESLMATQVTPLLCRHAFPDETAYTYILDGSRREKAFRLCFDEGRIGPDYQIGVIMCETPEEIAAATIIANTARLDVSEADVLLAIHNLSKQFKTPEEIAAILGLDTRRVRQMAAVGGLDPRFLMAFKDGRLDAAALRLLVKVTQPAFIERLAAAAEHGRLWHGDIQQLLAATESPDSKTVQIVGLDNYLAAGGTLESDLFDEFAGRLTDVPLLHKLWEERTKPFAQLLRDLGVEVHHHAHYVNREPDGRVALDWRWKGALAPATVGKAEHAAAKAAQNCRDLRDAGDIAGYLALIPEWVRLSHHAEAQKAKPLKLASCRLSSSTVGLTLGFYVDRDAYNAHLAETRKVDKAEESAGVKESRSVPHTRVQVDTAGYNHPLHERVTETAGHALALTLADNPAVAFDLQLASQFQECAFSRYDGGDRLIAVKVNQAPSSNRPEDDLRRPVIARLVQFRDDFKASGLHPFEWVQTLDGGAKGDLFALITALQVSTREAKTNALRIATRAEAAHVARATGHDIRTVWMPDGDFYGQFSKKQLLGFVQKMHLKVVDYAKMKREAIAPLVAEEARKHNFIPSQFNFELADPEPAPAADEADNGDQVEGQDETELEDVGA